VFDGQAELSGMDVPLRSSEFENGGKMFLKKKRHYQAARLYDVASQTTVILMPLWEITHIAREAGPVGLGSCSKVYRSSVDIAVPSVAQSWIAF
jgi:hypothetical protein